MQHQSAANASILLIVGADRESQFERLADRVRVRGTSDIYGLLDPNQPVHRLHLSRHSARQGRVPDLSPYRSIVNLITEAEQSDRVLEILRKLVRGTSARVINRPEAVLKSTRDQVARLLSGIPGLKVPSTVRLRAGKAGVRAVERAALGWPLILRQAGTHTGNIVGLVNSPEELEAGLANRTDHIATEFADYRSADGLYRKHRVWFIGRHRVFRHLLVSDHWNVHGKDRARFMADRPDLVEEEIALMAEPDGAFSPEVKAVLTEVRERMPLDFFGMDFGLLPDGRVLLFEANATMNFFSSLPGVQFTYLQRVLPPARAAFRELVGADGEAGLGE